MKLSFYFEILIILLSVNQSVRAESEAVEGGGDRVGNGGLAYVCRNAGAKITSAQLLDFWETEGLSTWRGSTAISIQIDVALQRVKAFSPNSFYRIKDALASLQSNILYTNRALTPTEDALPPYTPEKGCAYEQVARYEPMLGETGQKGLRINKEIYDSPLFSNSDRAALMVHEAIYYLDRINSGAQHSIRTRGIVAQLFSNSTIPTAIRMLTVAVGVYDSTRIYSSKTPAILNLIYKFSVGTLADSDKGYVYWCSTTNYDGSTNPTGWQSWDQMQNRSMTGSIRFEEFSSTSTADKPIEHLFPEVWCTVKPTLQSKESHSFYPGAEISVPEDVECLFVEQSDRSVGIKKGAACLNFYRRAEMVLAP